MHLRLFHKFQSPHPLTDEADGLILKLRLLFVSGLRSNLIFWLEAQTVDVWPTPLIIS